VDQRTLDRRVARARGRAGERAGRRALRPGHRAAEPASVRGAAGSGCDRSSFRRRTGGGAADRRRTAGRAARVDGLPCGRHRSPADRRAIAGGGAGLRSGRADRRRRVCSGADAPARVQRRDSGGAQADRAGRCAVADRGAGSARECDDGRGGVPGRRHRCRFADAARRQGPAVRARDIEPVLSVFRPDRRTARDAPAAAAVGPAPGAGGERVPGPFSASRQHAHAARDRGGGLAALAAPAFRPSAGRAVRRSGRRKRADRADRGIDSGAGVHGGRGLAARARPYRSICQRANFAARM